MVISKLVHTNDPASGAAVLLPWQPSSQSQHLEPKGLVVEDIDVTGALGPGLDESLGPISFCHIVIACRIS